jgi:hypothetical protein
VTCQDSAREAKTDKLNRKGKFFSVLQVVQFQNTGCTASSTRNGTCYTNDQCKTKGGTPSGSCASGYGVCCLFSLGCGATSSENCTYLVQASTNKAPSSDPCTYKICPNSNSICRIRLDFTSFTIAAPQVGTTVDTAANSVVGVGGGIGDCLTDSFAVTSPGKSATPIICGANTGQHIYVDASASCNVVMFDIGTADTTSTRVWDIKVTQYNCGDTKGGPPGCLQYFTGTTGRFSSFNFPTGSTVPAAATHLANQRYSICFRQEATKCQICFTTAITFPAIGGAGMVTTNMAAMGMQTSFGLSVSAMGQTIAQAQVDAACTADFLTIPGGITSTGMTGQIPSPVANVVGTNDRFCGRVFDTIAGAAASTTTGNSVCTAVRPFQIQFRTDATEVTNAMTAATNEQAIAPGGIIGFSLNYFQQGC